MDLDRLLEIILAHYCMSVYYAASVIMQGELSVTEWQGGIRVDSCRRSHSQAVLISVFNS